MGQDVPHLLASRRFLPLFLTQFLGALNDNLFKNAMAILILYALAVGDGATGQVLVSLAAMVFILPFFLFSATAGQLADKVEKAGLVRIVKLCEILVMALGIVGLLWGNIPFLMAVLFLLGTQSTFFGPLKYGILPVHLAPGELIAGNGLIEAGTFLAILLGTIVGGLVILVDGGVIWIAVLTLTAAVGGYASSRFIPPAPPVDPGLTVSANILAETWRTITRLRDDRVLFLSVLGISWFWLIGVVFLSLFPAYAKDVLGADEKVVTLFLTVFSIGIGIGSLLCNKALKGEVSARHVPLGALLITLFTFDLVAASPEAPATELMGVGAFLNAPGSWRILIDLAGIAISAGLYIVPLYALLQSEGDDSARSRIIAGNNIVNALFMVVGSAGAAGLLMLGLGVPQVFLIAGILNGLVAIYICGLLPEDLIKSILAGLLRLLYRVEVRGAENLKRAGDRMVMVVNHVSFLDGVLLGAFLPVKPTFAVDTFIARQWWVKPMFRLVDAFTVDPTNPMATKSLVKVVRDGHPLVIFPEGRITVTGALMKVYEGPGMIADKAEADLVPIRIDGAQYTAFSRLKGKFRLRRFPKITLTILPPRRFTIDPEIKGRQRRALAGQKLYDLMSDLIFQTCDIDRTLFDALLEAKAIHGPKKVVLEDVDRTPVTYKRLITGALVLGRRWAAKTAPGEAVGLMLPNSAGAVVAFFGLSAYGRVPAMLNFSTGSANMIAAIQAAQVTKVVTSRRFIMMARLQELVAQLAEHVSFIYLEDERYDISPFAKIYGALRYPFAERIHRGAVGAPETAARDGAVILFTSGSEGQPKGVSLSHRNLLANRYQLAARIDFNPTDTVFNALPVFHSFGLTGGTLLPVLSGIRIFMYPSPLHYRIIPALVYDTNATILFGTDTFLTGYARVAHPYDFYALRYVFAGAERVREETRRQWSDTFGVRILEGYGATETAPVLAVNTAMHFKAGTVGRFLPGIDTRMDPVPGVTDGARLSVTGPNVMRGYLKADNPGVLQPPPEGWYDTGDIVAVDDFGFVTIKGRAKRFAKIAGEMVSLTAVEALAGALWPDNAHAVVAIPDPKKGEQLVLVTDREDATREALLQAAKEKGLPELAVPKTVKPVESVPILGTGKVDYPSVTALVTE